MELHRRMPFDEAAGDIPRSLRQGTRGQRGLWRKWTDDNRQRYLSAMTKPTTKSTAKIHFKAKLSRPATPKGADWTFLLLPAAASAKLPTRSMVTVEGSFAG